MKEQKTTISQSVQAIKENNELLEEINKTIESLEFLQVNAPTEWSKPVGDQGHSATDKISSLLWELREVRKEDLLANSEGHRLAIVKLENKG